ncbi:MAG: MFS transporter [Woeseiaceae bacterium]|nr:MFS transporter [Woeseiaceae bacterium]
MRQKNLLDSRNGRFLTFALLYVSEGIPYGFTSVAMVTFMRVAGLSLDQIGVFTAALFVPWAFKFAWAPLIDLITLRRFGGRKAWVVFCTVMMIITLLMAAVVDFSSDFRLLLWMIVLNNVFCATQDVAIDSLAVSTLKENERGRGNGFMFGGQYTGIAMGGGGAVYVFGMWGLEAALLYVSVMQFLCLLFVLFFVRDPAAGSSEAKTENLLAAFARMLWGFLKVVYTSFLRSGRGPKAALLFSVLPTGALVLAYAALTTMQVDYGLTETEIARLSIMNTIAAAVGCVVGGVLADRFGIRKMMGIFYLISAVPGLALASQIASVGLTEIPPGLFQGLLVTHGFIYGTVFGTHAAIFMGVTNPAVAATQFTAFMAMGNVVISYTNYWQGIVAERFGYAPVLYIDAVLIVLGLAVLPFIRSREEELALADAPA